MVVGFALTVVLARSLGPEGLGLYGYAVLLVALAAVPISNGWATVLLRATARVCGGTRAWGEVSGLLRWGALLTLVSPLLLMIIVGLLVLGPFEQALFGFWVIALLAGVLFLDQLSALRLAVLRGLNYPIWGQVPEMLLRPVLILIIFLLVTWLKPDAPGILAAFFALIVAAAIVAVAGAFILSFKAPRALREAQPEHRMQSWARSATVLTANAGLIILNAQTDFLLLGLLGTPEDLGLYKVAMQIGLLSGFVYTALNMIAMQRFAHLLASGAHDELQSNATFLARLAFLGALPLPIVFWIWGETFLRVTFGSGFEDALTPIMWLLGLQLLNAGAGFAHSALVMAGREVSVLPLTILCVALNAGLCVLLIPRFGIAGAAMSSFVSLGFWNILLMIKVFVSHGIDTSILGALPGGRFK